MKLYYVYDALCGWCYGFSPVIAAFARRHENQLSIEVISGGMVTGSREGPIGEVAGYISWAYKEVEKATGVKFGNGFLNHTLAEGKAWFTSVPPAIALGLVKRQMPERQLWFANRLQSAIYGEGIAPNDLNAYAELAEEAGLDQKQFEAAMNTEEAQQRAMQDFTKTQELGVQGFPAVFAGDDTRMQNIAQGYVPLETLEVRFLAILQTQQ